jgi:glycosyltransferase involved in cell wall biosynthesis
MSENIYYLCPDDNQPSGGVKVIYQHVEILNRNGVPAYVAHQTDGFRCDWFDNDVPVLNLLGTKITKRDVLVYPEVWSHNIWSSGLKGIRKVVFNQGCYLTFRNYPINKDMPYTAYMDPDIVAVMVVSEDSYRYMSHAFPDLRIHRVRNYVDPERFSYCKDKKLQIAFMTNKCEEDIEQVVNILKYRGALGPFELTPVVDCDEQGVADIMRSSSIFLNFCHEEGFSLPAAEAMSCGCVVVGYHGNGARELMLPDIAYPIPQGDVIQFARSVEQVIGDCRRNFGMVLDCGRRASEHIRQHYSLEMAEAELMKAWNSILAT